MSHEEFMKHNALYGKEPEKKTGTISGFIDHLKDEEKCPPICSTERVEVEEFEPVNGKLKIRTETPEYKHSSGLKVGIVGCGRGLVSKHMFVDETLEEMQKVSEELEKRRLPIEVPEGIKLDHVDPAMEALAVLDQDDVLSEMAESAIKITEQGLPEGFVRGQIVNSLEGCKPGYKPVDYKLNEDGAPEPVVPYVTAIMQEGLGIITRNKRFYPAETLQRAHQMFLTDPETCNDMSVASELPLHLSKETEMIQFPIKEATNPYRAALEMVPESQVDAMVEKINRCIDIRSAYIPDGRYSEHELYVGEGISAKPTDKLVARYGNKAVIPSPDHEKPKFEDGSYPVFIPKTPDRLTTLQRYCWKNVNRMYGSIGTDYLVEGTSKKSRPLWFLQPARGNGRSLQEYKRFVEYMTGIRNNDEGIESFIKDITIHNLNVDCTSPSYYGSYWKNLMYITDVKLSGNIPLMIATYQNRAGYKYPSVSRYPHTIKKVKLNITTKKRGRLR